MRNFKKILSLVLAMAMMLSVMVVGAGAAFSDEDEFSAEYVTAAEALTNLGVLWGYEDGSFQPQDTITRAETAALIYRMATGDVTDAQKDIYTKMTNGFSDVPNGKWFAGYVNFCANAQYILGMGDGTFAPQANVTGYQTLAMILRAAGFDKDGEFAGADWEVKTASFAEKLGVLDNVKGSEDLGAPASRELVAQLLFAVMSEVELVHYAPFWGYVGQDTTLGEKQFELKQVEGVVWANEMANLGKDANAALEDGKTCIYEGGKTYNFYNLSTGLDIIGEQVTVWVADDTAVATPISKAETNTVWSDTTWANLTADEKADFTEDTTGHKVYNNYDTASSVHTGKGVYVKVIENGAGFDDYVLTEAQTLSAVTYIDNEGDVKLDCKAELDADVVSYTGIAKDDVVLYIEIDGTTYIEKAPYITGYITKVSHYSKADDTATIGGTDYAESAIYFCENSEAYDFTLTKGAESTYSHTYNGKTYNYYQDSYGNIVGWAFADEYATDYALILDYDMVNKDTAFVKDQLWVKYLTSDGNVATAMVDEDEGAYFLADSQKAKGDVVKFRLDAENEFVVVYPVQDVGGSMIVNDEDNMATKGNKQWNLADDFVAFFYQEMYGDAIYGVLTGEAAQAELDGRTVTTTQMERTEATTADAVGEISVVNINGTFAPATQYCYVVDADYTHTTDIGEATLWHFTAINAAGEEIEIVTEYPAIIEEGKVYEYVEHDWTFVNEGEVELNVVVEAADVAATMTGKLYVYAQDALNKFIVDSNANIFKNPAVFVDVEGDEVGGAVTLTREDPATGIVIYDGDEALAVFVTAVPNGDLT